MLHAVSNAMTPLQPTRPRRGRRPRALRWVLLTRTCPLILAAALALATAPAGAATNTWTGGGGDQRWHTPGSWSTFFPPANGDAVVLTNACASAICDPDLYDQGSSGGGPNPQLLSVTINPNTRGYAVSPSVGGTDVITLQSGGSMTDSNDTGGPDSFSTGVALNGPTAFTLSSGATGLQFLTRAITGAGPLTLPCPAASSR